MWPEGPLLSRATAGAWPPLRDDLACARESRERRKSVIIARNGGRDATPAAIEMACNTPSPLARLGVTRAEGSGVNGLVAPK